MAEVTIENSKLFISGFGHFYTADVGTPWPNLNNYKFGDTSTHAGWSWLGDTSGENIAEFESEGGEIEFKSTWDRKKAKSKRSDREITGTINSVNISRETFEKAFPAGKWNEASKSYTVQDKVIETTKAVILIMEDGGLVAGLGLYKATLAGDMPKFDAENFAELPLKVAVLPDNTGQLLEIFEPREVTAKPARVGG